MISLYFLLGVISGIMSGLFGIGGGIIVVPALTYLFAYFQLIPQQDIMHTAIGTSIAAMIVTTTSALYSHYKRGSVRWDMVRTLLPGLLIGSLLGAVIASHLSAHYLRLIFALFLLFMGYRIFAKKIKQQAPLVLPGSAKLLLAIFIGKLSTILGAGGGTMMIPYMLRCHLTLREAAGTSVTCGLGICILATALFMILHPTSSVAWSTGYIYWPAFLGISMASVFSAPIGTALAHKLPTSILKRLLGICLICVGIDMLFTN
jgi:uncharacterized protein